jgi:hypothetical protein
MNTATLAVDLHGRGEGAESVRGSAAPTSALPCQNSNNCVGNDFVGKPVSVSPYRKKSRHWLEMAIEWMVKKHGINHV